MMKSKNRQVKAHVTEEAIAKRAYEIWQERGCPDGDGDQDWQTAKAELLAEAGSNRGPLLRLFDRLRNKAALA